MSDQLDEVHAQVLGCTKCALHQTRTKAVPGVGSSTADIMFVGEGPGAHEDAQGFPFVGSAGKFLDELLELAGLKREEIFIANVVKCRPVEPGTPPKNRRPSPDEIAECRDYLVAQIALIKPKVICTLGDTAMRALLPEIDRRTGISKLHAQAFTKGGIIYVPLYHPAAALHRGQLRDVIKDDMLKLKDILKQTFGTNN